jgi:hypothetical protein
MSISLSVLRFLLVDHCLDVVFQGISRNFRVGPEPLFVVGEVFRVETDWGDRIVDMTLTVNRIQWEKLNREEGFCYYCEQGIDGRSAGEIYCTESLLLQIDRIMN